MSIKRKKKLHGYKILHGGDLNKNGNSSLRKLLMHGYTFSIGGDIHGNETFRKRATNIKII